MGYTVTKCYNFIGLFPIIFAFHFIKKASLYSRSPGTTLFHEKSCWFSGCWFMTTEGLVNDFVFDKVDSMFINIILMSFAFLFVPIFRSSV